jgi:hypothetical protein
MSEKTESEKIVIIASVVCGKQHDGNHVLKFMYEGNDLGTLSGPLDVLIDLLGSAVLSLRRRKRTTIAGSGSATPIPEK